jgi:hypothetical protein
MTSTMPNKAKVMIGMVAVASLCPLFFGAANWQTPKWPQLALLMIAAALTSQLKVKLPGMTSTMSGNMPVILLGITQLGLLGGLMVAATAAIAQSAGSGKLTPVKLLFNTCTLINATALAYAVYHSQTLMAWAGSMGALAMAAAAYFLANTAPVAGIISLTENKNAFAIWHKTFLWSFPNYVVGAGLAAFASQFTTVGLISLVAVVAVLFGVYRSYKMFVGLVEQSAEQSKAMAMAMAAGR